MIRTRLLAKFSDVFYPILHFSLGPRNVGAKSTLIEEAYGYLWLLVQNPDTGALMLYLVKDADGRDYNWIRSQSIPPTVSYSNPVSLYIPNHESVVWATFAFTEEGEPLFAIERIVGGTKKIEVYDRDGNVWLEITNAKSPFIVPEALINRKVVGSNVYVFYIPFGDSEIRYQGVIDTSDMGSVTSVPVNARSDLFIVDYTYRKDGIELVYSTPLRNFLYVHIEAEAYHLDEESSLVSGLSLSRIRKAIRDLSRISVSASLVPGFIKKVYFGQEEEYSIVSPQLTEGEIEKVFLGMKQDPIYVYFSGTLLSIPSIYLNQTTEELDGAPFTSHELVQSLFRLPKQDDVSTFTEASGIITNSLYRSQNQDQIDSSCGSDVLLQATAYRVLDDVLVSPGDFEVEHTQTSLSSHLSDNLELGVVEDYMFIYQSCYLGSHSEYCNVEEGLNLRYRQTVT